MIIISEYSNLMKKSAGSDYLRKMEEAAKLIGIPIINFKQGDISSLEEAFYYKRNIKKNQTVFWLGFVPNPENYILVEKVLKKYKLQLINSYNEFAKSEYFDNFYSYIEEDTIPSGIATEIEHAKSLAKLIEYPLFLKGTIQSLKKYGWENCIANDENELVSIFMKLKAEDDFSLGTIILRKFIELNHAEIGGNGIPKAHEYRFFILNQNIIDYSFYWNGSNPFTLSKSGLKTISDKAISIAKKVNVPFISVDIAETKDNEWIVIEIGDGQFSDIRNISPLKFWKYISEN